MHRSHTVTGTFVVEAVTVVVDVGILTQPHAVEITAESWPLRQDGVATAHFSNPAFGDADVMLGFGILVASRPSSRPRASRMPSALRFATGEVQEIRVVTVVVTVRLVLVVTVVETEVETGGVIVVVVVEVTTGILRKELRMSWCILLTTALTTLQTAEDAAGERLLGERSMV